jgi:NitT/TauT family transport system substrate-binding protein
MTNRAIGDNFRRSRVVKLAIPDLISNSYFPALAAAELGFFAREGIEVAAELIFPVDRAYQALRDGEVDFVGGAAHGALAAFPEWRGVKLLGALAQGMYWFLVMRIGLGIARGDLTALKGRRIGAAPWVEMGLRRLLMAAGFDLRRDGIAIGPVPGAVGPSVNFGLTAAAALEAGAIDGFWANGMAAELAVTSGVGTIVLDVRRGDGPAGCFGYTMPVLATTDRLIGRSPQTAAAAVRALVAAQNALRADVSQATEVGRKRFPPREAGLIADIVARDLPFYDAAISQASVAAINDFARRMSLLDEDIAYSEVVATQFGDLWRAVR